ncbi:hypothetical protein ACFV30_00435 [Streptomyces sp. NPDC059752]|uniref:hypothetical protein n=1 Tax=unclassified Streptomyces TaxID=2593676 RepID=UPI00365BF617
MTSPPDREALVVFGPRRARTGVLRQPRSGLFDAVVFAGILAAGGRAVYAAVGWGLAMWPAAALVTAVFVPRLRAAQAPA